VAFGGSLPAGKSLLPADPAASYNPDSKSLCWQLDYRQNFPGSVTADKTFPTVRLPAKHSLAVCSSVAGQFNS